MEERRLSSTKKKKIRYRMDIQRERASNINVEKEESYR